MTCEDFTGLDMLLYVIEVFYCKCMYEALMLLTRTFPTATITEDACILMYDEHIFQADNIFARLSSSYSCSPAMCVTAEMRLAVTVGILMAGTYHYQTYTAQPADSAPYHIYAGGGRWFSDGCSRALPTFTGT